MEYQQAFFLYTAAIKLFDALTVLAAWYGCWYLRFHLGPFPAPKGIPPLSQYSRVTLPLLVGFLAVFHLVGAYRRDRIHFGFRAIKKVTQGAILGTLVFVSLLYFVDEMQYSRVFLGLFSVTVIAALLIERGILELLWRFAETRLVRRISILLAGTGDLLNMYLTQIESRRPYPIRWVGRLGDPDASGPLSRIPYLGNESALEGVLRENPVELVVISYPNTMSQRYGALLERLSHELVGVKVLPDFGRYSTFTYSAEHECGIPLLVFNQAPTGATDRAIKRIVDMAGSLAFMAVFASVYAAIAILIKLTSKGPIFYSQVRVGADGRVFTLYKFRSMNVDAEARTGAVWAREGDDRATNLGRWLRRTSLDEIPQFYNVLRGDMSLVGPRPERPVFVEEFRKQVPKYMLRHRMKSGITGWAQINGWRGNTSIEERIKHDLYYIGHWSHYFDIKILCLTFFKGFIHRNAY